ncbi:MAG TPA: MBOAT family O-acyltransferase, partial [Roseimicrobium sp.]|nr:MBOAT family O-acyltransferase [Roseimicrobium sp.]
GVWDARFLALLATSTTVDYLCGLAITGVRIQARKVFALGCLPVLWLMICSATGLGGHPVGWNVVALAAVLPVILICGYAVFWRLPAERRPKAFMLLSIGLNLGQLGFFKYFNFFASSAERLLTSVGLHPGPVLLQIILPVGISFYTFQSISYAVDVYKRRVEPEKNFLTFATFLSFFPQLVAGPIERCSDLLPQLQKLPGWDTENFHRGCRLILIGLFKKVFVADNSALLANYAFDNIDKVNGAWALLGAVAFAFQIYGDFSGYTDIARGSARMLGVQLRHNFHFPYFATGPSDFWQRWHISLSSWFRDYVYIPLGGNRGGNGATVRNLLITMGLAGLWHGAAWTFVVWGLYHGLLLATYRMVPPLAALEKQEGASRMKIAGAMALMGAFTVVGWVIFRSPDLSHVALWFRALTVWQGSAECLKPLAWLAIHALPLVCLQIFTWKHRDEIETLHWPWAARGLVYGILILAVASSAVSEQEFIYFQF